MATIAKKPRKRINRFVLTLARIYDLDYKVTQRIYNQFNDDIESCKMTLNLEKQRRSMSMA